jgi:thioredoxin 1
MSAVSQVNTNEFETRAVQNDQLVLVDFSAEWCGPCRRMEPELEAAAQELQGKATVLKVDVDADPELAIRFGVQGIPNLTFLKGGQVVDVIVGAAPRSAILAKAKAHL